MVQNFEWIAHGFRLTEGPRIDDHGMLYFGDVTGHGFFRCPRDGEAEAIDAGRLSVGGVVVDEEGGVLCSGRDGILRFDPVTGERRAVTILFEGVPIVNVNELEADPAGNLYGGTLEYEAFEHAVPPKPSMVFRLNRDGTTKKLLERTIPNGMDFSADGRHFYLSESGDGIYCYEIDAAGELGNRRGLASMPDCDGMLLDSAGGFWVARYLSNLLEYHDAEGALVRSVELPFGSVTSVTMGGDDLCDLYVTGGDLRERGKGGIVRFRTDIPGVPVRKAAVFA